MAGGWWLFVLRGVMGIVFGAFIFFNPGIGLVFVLGFLAAWMAVDGIASLVQAIRGRLGAAGRSRPWLVLDGVISLGVAAFILFAPGLSAIALVICVGAWALMVGGARLVLAWRTGSGLLGLLGAVSIVAGVILLIAPGTGLLAVIWIIGLEAIAMGALFIGFGLHLKRMKDDPSAAAA